MSRSTFGRMTRLRLADRLKSGGLLTDSVLSFAVGIVTSAIGLLSGVIAAGRLGADGRGQVALIQIVVAASVILGGLGLPDAIIYFVRSRGVEVCSLYLRLERLVCVGAAVFALVAMAVAAMLWAWFDLRGTITAMLYCLVVLPHAQLMLIGGALRASGRLAAWNGTRVFAALVWLVALALPQSTSVSTVLKVHTVLMTLGWLIFRTVVTADATLGHAAESDLNRAVLRYGAPSALIGLPVLLNGKVDQVVVAASKTIGATGVYAAAAGLAAGAFLLPQSVALVLFPAVASGRLGGREQTRRIVRLGLPLCLLVGWVYGFAGFGAWPYLFGARFAAGRFPTVILSVAWALAGFNAMLEEILRGLGRSRVPLATQSISAVSTIVCVYALTRRYGLGGAAFGSLAGFAAGTLALLVLIKRVYSTSSTVGSRLGPA